MTSPQADGADRLPLSTGSTLRASTAASGLLILLLVGLLLRLTIAYVLLPASGFDSDIATYSAWAQRLFDLGPGSFYSADYFADYPPGYLYVLWLGSHLVAFFNGGTIEGTSDLLKLGPIVADVAVGAVLFLLVRRWTTKRSDSVRLSVLAAGLYLFNPATWYDSAVWGQTDAVGALIILLGIAALIRGNSEGATAMAALALLVKPQFGVVLIPIVAIVLLRRHLLVPGSGPRNKVLLPGPPGGWLEREQGVWRLVSSALVGLGLLVLLLLPFNLDIVEFVALIVQTAGGYPWLSVNAYNLWALIGAGGTDPLAFGGYWSSDTVPLLGPLPGVAIGTFLLVAGFLVGLARLAWRSDRRSILVVTAFLALAFFALPTRVHERYLFPVFAVLPLLAVFDRRWLWATIALSIAAFINLHGVLTTPLYATPNLETLPLGELFRQPLGIITSALLSAGAFAFVAWQLRPAAALRGSALFESDRDPYDSEGEASLAPAPVGLAMAVADGEVADLMPVESAVAAPSLTHQVRGWFARLTASTSVRRDRSALIVSEPGGRLDRRDLMVVLLVFVAAMLLRTYRLEVPYSMHFDEVYHARTATEFLQEWRYGEPHQIYEFTHPHLAKYVMAVGIAGLGNNRVTAEADLGVPVASAVLEERWSPSDALGVRNGDRLYIATGTELRVYDLADRTLETTVSGPFTALAVDPDRHTLLLGGADGAIWQLDTTDLDALRLGTAGAIATAQPLTTVGDLAGDLSELAMAEGQLIAVSDDGTVVSLDAESGSETGRTELATAHSPVGTPSRTQVIVDPALVDDPAAAADTLAGLLDDDADRIEAVILAATEPVAIAEYIANEEEDPLQTEMDAGNLPGVSMESAPGVALATDSGISLLDAATLAELGTFATDEPVGGMTFVEEGADDPSVYAASGQELVRLRLPTDADVSLGASIWMPNTVTDVVWNPTTTMVHALGLSQDGAASTIYVIEPRSNSVFADARLDFAPTQLVLDVQPERPAEDRVDMLAFDASGRVATVDIGGNGYAYRLPGVIAGALTAALIYLLVRFLFMRRTVALIAALLVLVDGMFFANARIAMNDTYVALFIVAAFTLFVPLWLGRWHSRWAIVTGLLGVGLLLGLALASKWVGAYAIGAVGLLILLRSALGRLIALAAMILMTGLLGYIAISPSTTAATPQLNYLFLILMITLTVLLTVGITRRPVRFTLDELRLVVLGPMLGGAAALAFGVYRSMSPPTEGTSLTPERLFLLGAVAIGFGLAVGAGAWFAGRRGLGPLARVPRVELIAEPASPPPPRGWLRPGSGALGLPWLLGLAAITIIPLAIYGASYLPWIELGNRWTDTFPAGNFGQTFIELQKSMYDYHNNLRAAHAASSPWWAWPLDLKPVWFEQNSYAGNTTAVIYDTGNLVIFWLAIPAVAWVAFQAWRRRSLSLAFICVAIACLWLPWARIDRATFQYHIFTTLPFSFMALAYFLAELWHGPSKGTWLLARVAAALAIIGAPLLWLLRQPLCGMANTERANPGTEVCASLSRDLMLTDIQGLGLLLAIGGLIAAGVFVFSYLRGSPETAVSGDYRPRSSGRSLVLPVSFSVALLGVVVLIIGAGLPGRTLLTTRIHAEWPALAALLLLLVPALFVLRATDPRRYVVGALSAAVLWFVAFYTNIASLPVPTPLSQIHLGLLPTWNWGFQFGVNLDPAGGVPLQSGGVILLTVAVCGLCVAAAYAARNWNSLRAQPAPDVSEVPEGG